MAAVKNSAKREVESVKDYTQELSGSHTSSPTSTTSSDDNNSMGPQRCQSLDVHQSLLNGAQPYPFVCGGVLDAPCSDDSLPSGALVNGSASHCTSEEPHVPNKDASPLPGTDTNPEVLEPPSELQSNTWQKPDGHFTNAPSTQTSSESDNSGCETPLLEGDGDNASIGQLWTSNGVEPSSLWDVDCNSESSESSSDDYEGLNRGLREKFMYLLLKGGALDRVVKRKREIDSLQPSRKREMLMKRVPSNGNVNGCNANSDCDSGSFLMEGSSIIDESLKACAGSHQKDSCVKKSIMSDGEVGGQDESDTHVDAKPAALKRSLETESESELSFFQCTKCDANFKEKRQLHRHMMYHLDLHHQEWQESLAHPFICKECGRLFRERSFLQKHMLIHQVRREKLMEEIKSLNESGHEGSRGDYGASGHQPCSGGAETPDRDEDESCYSREEPNHETSTKSDLEAHQRTSDLNPSQRRLATSFGMYFCPICTFTSKSRSIFREHLQLVHDRAFSDYELQSAQGHGGLTSQNKAHFSPKPKFLKELQNKKGLAGSSMRSNGLSNLYIPDNGAPETCKGLNSPVRKWSFSSLANNPSASSLQRDMPSKLSYSAQRKGVPTDLSIGEEGSQERDANSRASFDMESSSCIKFTNNPKVVAAPSRKVPSKRKMSTPSRNTPVNTFLISSKPKPASSGKMFYPFHSANYDSDDPDHSDLNAIEHHQTPYTPEHVLQPGRLLHRVGDDNFTSEQSDFVDNSEYDDEIRTLVVKEENIETSIGEDNSEYQDMSDSYTSYSIPPMFEMEQKCCPYCPAVFDSGVGLSNHIRGHLHRLGLRYEARHMLSPEQVASQDQQPRVRRRVATIKRIKKATEKPAAQTEHTCPLCLGWFDTKTGLSNHVRGHLKRLGKSITGVSKSPLSILKELLQDRNEHSNMLQVLEPNLYLSRPFISQNEFAENEGPSHEPTDDSEMIQHYSDDLIAEDEEMNETAEEKVNGVTETSSTLVELLKERQPDRDPEDTVQSQTARARFMVPSLKTASSKSLPEQPDPSRSQDTLEPNKKVCIHCNATFHSGVSLSNHLRAYARRKKLALEEGTTYDCSVKRARSRSGPKRKTFQTQPTTSEVIYTLPCRFCDLVFEGPQHVQEDWVKHLQRHLMHSGTGAPMVEIPALPAVPPVREEQSAPDRITQGQ
ncbi:zinc finger protein 644 [Trichomycterus rosablanca]|uniref:zinc finger protein 644 n=1 Tax=Trichomycterus rosablanca TaxID=2290929 RepID=UPI002F352B38